MKNKIKPISAKKYFDKKTIEYRFPFQVLDDTPGGENLGRIEVCIEPFRSRKTEGIYYIDKIWVWFRQTRDKRYDGKIFEIPCCSESIKGDLLSEKGKSFISKVWRVFFCDKHKNPVFEAYPENHHKELVIEAHSSILMDIRFE